MCAVSSFVCFSSCNMIACILILFHVSGLTEASTLAKVIYMPGDEIIEMPDSCAKSNMNYCLEKGSNYPKEEIEYALQDFLVQMKERQRKNSFGYRIGSTGTKYGDVNCPAVVHQNAPIHYIIDEDDAVRAVAQIPHKFNQNYDIADCSSTGLINNTRHFDKGHNRKYFCKEMRMPLELFVLTADWTSLEKVKVKGGIPVCCSCRYQDSP